MTERVIIALQRPLRPGGQLKERPAPELPHESTLANDEFVDVTRDVWRIDAESATRIGHPRAVPGRAPPRV